MIRFLASGSSTTGIGEDFIVILLLACEPDATGDSPTAG